MNAQRICSACGVELPTDAAEDMCPKCLLEVGIQTSSSGGDSGSEHPTLPPSESSGEDEATLPPHESSTESPSPGTKVRYFGDYELLEEIARGGMGVVYKARQVSLNRIVALKMILAGQLAGEAEIQRFHTEAEAAAKLDHPGIVPIYEVGEHEGQHYFSMGFVEGQSLADELTSGPLPPKEAAQLTKHLADAIAYAHEQGVIHRDLKPANILLDRNSQPRITDFGLAKRMEADSHLTGTGQVLGTPSFMPPEQAAGKTHEIGPAADVYALGAVLYTMLTGRPPFQAANSMDTLLQVLEKDPVAVRQLDAGVPRDLETICLKCLEKEADRRYASAAETADELRRFVEGEPIQARPLGPLSRTWRWVRRHPAAAGFLGATGIAAIALATLGVAYVYQRQLEEKNTQLASSNELLTASKQELEQVNSQLEIAKQRLEKSLESEQTALYFRRVSLALSAWKEGEIARARQLLDQCPAERRHFEWHYVDRLCRADRRTMKGHKGGITSVTFSPDGKRIASGSFDYTMKTWDVATGANTLTIEEPAYVQSVAFSPDGKRIATSKIKNYYRDKDKTVRLWDAETGQEVSSFTPLFGESDYGVNSVVFSPDGKRLAGGVFQPAGDDPVCAIVWDANTGEEFLRLKGEESVDPVAFSPDGKSILGCCSDQTVKVWDVESGEITLQLAHANRILSVAFSPDGRQIVTGTANGVKVWNAETGEEMLTLRGHTDSVLGVAFSSDGKRVVSGSEDHTIRVWDAQTGENILTLRGHTGAVLGVAYSPDGKSVVSGSADGTVKLWDPEKHQEALELQVSTPETASDPILNFSPDSQQVMSSYLSHVKIWNAETGHELFHKTPSIDIRSAQIRPDGKRILLGCSAATIEGTVRVWDADRAEFVRKAPGLLKTFGKRLAQGWTGNDTSSTRLFMAMAFDADGSRILGSTQVVQYHGNNPPPVDTVSDDYSLRLWEWETGQEILRLQGHTDWVRSVAFSPTGKRIVSGGSDKTVKLWDAETGKEMLTLKGHTHDVYAVGFSPDGQQIVSGSIDRTIRVWDAETGREMLTLKGHANAVTSVAYSPDGKRIVSGSVDKRVKVWDAETGLDAITFTHTLKGDNNTGVQRVAFSPDGRRIAAANGTGTVKLWVGSTIDQDE